MLYICGRNKSDMSKHLRFGFVTALIYWFGMSFGWAQVNPVTDVVDPDTKLFSDGKTTIEAYVNTVLTNTTNCCGDHTLYLKVTIDDAGFTSTVRCLSGKDECVKKSVEEILSYLRWKVNGAPKTAPIIPIKVKINCEPPKALGSPYVKLGEPAGFAEAKAKLAKSGANGTGGTEPIASGEQPNSGTSEKPANNNSEDKNQVQPQQNQGEPAGRGYQPGGNPISVTPNDTAASKRKMQPTELPDPVYKGAGERKPDSSHIKSYSNERGPQFEQPKFIDGDAGMGVFVKTTYRKLQYCGLANVTAELTIEPDGNVSAYRIFKTNNDKVNALTPYVLGSMRFQRLPRRTYFVLQYQSDVDCEGFPKNAVDKAHFYFSAPDKAPRSLREDSSSSPINNGGKGDVLDVKKLKDE